MKRGNNQSRIIGCLAESPDIQRTEGGYAMARIIVEIPRTWKDRQNRIHKDYDVVPCLLKGRDAENAEGRLRKGSSVLAEGHLVTRTYRDDKGNQVSTTELLVEKIVYLTGMQEPHRE